MICPKCGTEYDGNFCPKGCNSPILQKKNKNNTAAAIILLIVFFPVGLYLMWAKTTWHKAVKIIITLLFGLAVFSVIASNLDSDTGTPIKNVGEPSNNLQDENDNNVPADNNIPQEMTEDEYKAACEDIDYADAERYPENNKGKKVKFTGKVLQVSEPGIFTKNTTFRVAITKGEYGIWDDVVYVEYKRPKDAPRILVDDIITIWGECTGVTSYTTILLQDITIPAAKAKYITINQ